ncbi:MAG: hypothetical protein DKT66_23280 [Candidatus Melainabacteria bacterium]|nr:MAG: hypothetical protein DKT66_23280 [Candidatus Melainabacteria bacterium]
MLQNLLKMSNNDVIDRTEPRICIYCKFEKRFQRGKRGGDFNSEHVIPQAFASVKNSLTLIGQVCSDCNGELGRTIDQNLSRGTVEAIDRFKEKQKPAEKIGELSRKKLNISLEKSQNETIRKAHVDLTHEGTELKQQFAVQLTIRLKGSNEWLAIKRSDVNFLDKCHTFIRDKCHAPHGILVQLSRVQKMSELQRILRYRLWCYEEISTCYKMATNQLGAGS